MNTQSFFSELTPLEIQTYRILHEEFPKFCINSTYSGSQFTQLEVINWFINAQAPDKLKFKLALTCEQEIAFVMRQYQDGASKDIIMRYALESIGEVFNAMQS